MKQTLSQLRVQLRDAQRQLPALLEECFRREPLLPGSIYILRRKCGKANCRCTRGELHESTVLSYRGDGRPRNVSLDNDQIGTLRKGTDGYRRAKQARAKLVRWQRQVLTLVDAIEAARVELGKGEFQAGRSSASRHPRSLRS